MSVDHLADPWAWVHEESVEDAPPSGFDKVTAILVSHNSEESLAQTLIALARLQYRPGRIVAVDAGSDDHSFALLRRAKQEGLLDEVRLAPPNVGFSAITSAVVVGGEYGAELPETPQESWDYRSDGWIWLLHDDCMPEFDCLTELLRAATTPDPQHGPAIVIPKLLRPRLRNHPNQMNTIGETISYTGHRIRSIEPGDIDQRQDESAPVLGGSTAGMLIRVDAWNRLGGLARELPVFRAGVDLGWRANEAGLVVQTCPEAAVYHEQSGLLGMRESQFTQNPEVTDLCDGMRVVAAHSRQPGLTALRLRVSNRFKWVMSLIGKDSTQAKVYVQTAKRFRSSATATERLARRVQNRSGKAEKLPSGLIPGPWWGLRNGIDGLFSRVDDRFRAWTEPEPEYGIDALTSDEDFGPAPLRPFRLLAPGLVTAVVLLVFSIIAARGAFGGGVLMSSELASAPKSLGDAWSAWLVPGAGQFGANAPWLGLFALGSTLSFGQPGWFAVIAIFGSALLATGSAYKFLHRLVERRWVALGLATLWGLLIPVSGAMAAGSFSVVLVAITVPFLASGCYRWYSDPVKDLVGLCAPATVALALTVLVSVTPALWIPGALGVVLLAWRRSDLRGGLIAGLGPIVAIAPWIPRLLTQPERLITGVDPTVQGASGALSGLDAFAQLLGRSSDQTNPLWFFSIAVFGLAWLFGLIGFMTTPRTQARPLVRRVLLLAWVIPPLAGVVLSRFVVHIEGIAVRPGATTWLLLGLFVGFSVLAARLETATSSELPIDQMLRAITALGLIVALLAGSAWWLWRGASTPMTRQSAQLPSYVTAVQDSPRATRTLMIDLSDGLAQVSLTDAEHPRWGDGEVNPLLGNETYRFEVLTLAQQFADGVGSDSLSERLGRLGIGHVWLRGAEVSASTAISSLPGLSGAVLDDATMIWTVGGLPSRVQLLRNQALTPVTEGAIDATQAGDVLVILDQSDTRWVVTVGGQRLVAGPRYGDYATFALDGATGALEWHRSGASVSAAWEIIAVLVLLAMAVPASTHAYRSYVVAARRAA